MAQNEQPRHFKNPEPRFDPTWAMKTDLESWRALPDSERISGGFAFDGEIKRLLFERVQQLHPDWSREQHEMMFFRLRYAGEHFEEFAGQKVKRGYWHLEEVEQVRAFPIPLSRADGGQYAAISHPDMDEEKILWPNAIERGTNI